jgi:hypothetical protein
MKANDIKKLSGIQECIERVQWIFQMTRKLSRDYGPAATWPDRSIHRLWTLHADVPLILGCLQILAEQRGIGTGKLTEIESAYWKLLEDHPSFRDAIDRFDESIPQGALFDKFVPPSNWMTDEELGVRKPVAVEILVQRLEQYIKHHPFPGERELAIRFQCSRGSIRAAIKRSEPLQRAQRVFEAWLSAKRPANPREVPSPRLDLRPADPKEHIEETSDDQLLDRLKEAATADGRDLLDALPEPMQQLVVDACRKYPAVCHSLFA